MHVRVYETTVHTVAFNKSLVDNFTNNAFPGHFEIISTPVGDKFTNDASPGMVK